MHRLERLNTLQRVLLVVASGMAIRAVTVAIVVDSYGGGWFGYAPNTDILAASTPRRFSPVVTMAITVVAIVLWAAVSLRLLASNATKRDVMNGADVAIACCRASDTAAPSDLYPDPDAGLLADALHAVGASSVAVAWDDRSVDWETFGQVLVSSTWDSVDRPVEYLAWTRKVSAVSTLLNPADVIEWGLDKTHQQVLAEAGVPVIPTTWIAPHQDWRPDDEDEFVVKPSVSAGGRGTARYDPSHADQARAHVRALQRAGQTVMVQPYLHAVDEVGELDVVFIDGVYSHAVRKQPALRLGEGVVEQPWERMAWSGVVTPEPHELEVAERTMCVVTARVDGSITYGRVDIVIDAGGTPVVLEVELIDPYLSLDMVPSAATRLAHAIVGPAR